MSYRGVFIGIDRYASPGINWLGGAKRDAVALHALFGDAFGDGAALLVDESATRSAIEAEFMSLAECGADDLVVIAFSGHGSEAHQLVPYDTNRSDLDGTTIPLSTLTEWFSRIPAKRLICILDCCFSGGMGAKALQVDAVPRDLPSTESLLDQLGGEGRVIVTATLPTEKAWETARTGHGLLTGQLLAALQGAHEVRVNGAIGTYQLIDYVTQRVIEAARAIGKEQHPTMRGTIDRDLTWPLFVPRARYLAAFPDRGQSQASSDLQSLQAFGFPPALIASWSTAIPALNALQIEAINDFGILGGENVLVSAPTSSGKTMIGELAGLKGALDRQRAFFLFPLKALVNDKLRHFQQVYGAYGIRTIRATGDSTSDDIVPLMRGQYDVCLMTYEKFAALVVANPHLLEQVGTIVVDEAQMIADKSRGINLEFILTYLRGQRRHGVQPQLIALSAVIGNTNRFEAWLGGRLLKHTERPVPIDEGVIRGDGSWRYIQSDTGEEKVASGFVVREYGKGSSQELIKPLVGRLVSEDKQVIVFRETKGEARGCARYLAEYLGLQPVSSAIDALPAADPSQASQALRETLAHGVAFHIADLDPDERSIVEEAFRSRPTALRVIAATTTLAMGVNTPAEAVVIAGLEHPGDTEYSVAEYKNMVGRAGRLGFANRGASYLVAMDQAEEHRLWTKYVIGQPEDLESRFVVGDHDQRSVALRVLVAVGATTGRSNGMTADEIGEFLEESFGATQQKIRQPGWVWRQNELAAALLELTRHGLLTLGADSRYQPTDLGRFAGESGAEVETVVRIVEALAGNSAEAISEPALIAATQVSVELDAVLFPINKRSTQKEPQQWRSELSRQGIPGSVLSAMGRNARDSVQVTLRAKKAVACLLWTTDRPLVEIEQVMTQFGGAFEAAGAIRAVRSRTCDMLPLTARIAELTYPGLDYGTRLPRLLARLELGVPSSLVELAMLAGTRLTRGDYLQLLHNGLQTVAALEVASDSDLARLLSGDLEKVSSLRMTLRSRREAEALANQVPILPPFEA